jgi:hypothetical protein
MPPARARKTYGRRSYFRNYNRSRPNDARLTDEPACFAFQINGDPANADQDDYYTLRWTILKRALPNLEQATDLRDGLLYAEEEPTDYSGSLSDITDWFMEDEFSVYHPPAETQATTPTDDSQRDTAPPAGWYSIEKADEIFSFAGLCLALDISIRCRARDPSLVGWSTPRGFDRALNLRWVP